ncbi:MAG: hypothetical protein QG625_4451 [Cyanobacteriota bacterium erpe_2018_sw_39hr_WHONDRS-SW48-000098_B_bin.30]|nr:hypothetical protein [Cyanobacteriota bacterium erpe_2018_sw_39hr_WHONDRS-SW48-000098_B_bin.30]
MMPVARAAKLLDVSVKKLEKRLEQGLIQGVQRQISERNGGKYSWFIYAGAFESLLETRVKACEARISTEGLDQLFFTDFGDGSLAPNDHTADLIDLHLNIRQYIEDDGDSTAADATSRYGLSLVKATTQLTDAQILTPQAIAPETLVSPIQDLADFTTIESESDFDSTTIDIIDFTASYYCEEDEQHLESTSATSTSQERNTNIALASELLQHLRQEKQRNEILQARIDELAGQVSSMHEEMSAIRIEVLAKPVSKNLFGKIKSYFGFSDGRM